MKKLIILILGLLVLTACSENPQEVEVSDFSVEKKRNISTTYPVVQVPSTDWNITADTTLCGSLVLNWTRQPNKPAHVKYVILPTPLFTVTSLCAGGLNTLNPPLYYQYGWGCSFAASKPYSVKITYSVVDSVLQKVFVYTSLPDTIMTGRGLWNCN